MTYADFNWVSYESWTITITHDGKSITMQDRNVWATTVWFGSWDEAPATSYGDYFTFDVAQTLCPSWYHLLTERLKYHLQVTSMVFISTVWVITFVCGLLLLWVRMAHGTWMSVLMAFMLVVMSAMVVVSLFAAFKIPILTFIISRYWSRCNSMTSNNSYRKYMNRYSIVMN